MSRRLGLRKLRPSTITVKLRPLLTLSRQVRPACVGRHDRHRTRTQKVRPMRDHRACCRLVVRISEGATRHCRWEAATRLTRWRRVRLLGEIARKLRPLVVLARKTRWTHGLRKARSGRGPARQARASDRAGTILSAGRVCLNV